MSRDGTPNAQPMHSAHGLDMAALSAWLSANLSGFEGPVTIEMFKGGQSNPTYKLVTPRKS